jgi:hypothetical protein
VDLEGSVVKKMSFRVVWEPKFSKEFLFSQGKMN